MSSSFYPTGTPAHYVYRDPSLRRPTSTCSPIYTQANHHSHRDHQAPIRATSASTYIPFSLQQAAKNKYNFLYRTHFLPLLFKIGNYLDKFTVRQAKSGLKSDCY